MFDVRCFLSPPRIRFTYDDKPFINRQPMNASTRSRPFVLPVSTLACLAALRLAAQPVTNAAASPNTVPDLRTLLSPPQNEMRVVAQRYQADRGNLSRYYSVTLSPEY